jgi:8-oxo-dGTP pyrophosphatase MutT (NUDIX family)
MNEAFQWPSAARLSTEVETVFSQLRQQLEAAPPKRLGSPLRSLRESAVLVPLFLLENELHTLFTKRPDSLRHHGGQISFPGGIREPTDASPLQTALRETQEEIGLPADRVVVLGALDEVQTITQFSILPFVGEIPSHFLYQIQLREVEAVIEAPVRRLLDPAIHRVERRRVMNEEHEIYFYEYGPHLIWGATARILRNLLELLIHIPEFNPSVS